MTLAIDIRTGRVIGQVADAARPFDRLEGRYVVQLVTRDGYKQVPLSSVRLEVVR